MSDITMPIESLPSWLRSHCRFKAGGGSLDGRKCVGGLAESGTIITRQTGIVARDCECGHVAYMKHEEWFTVGGGRKTTVAWFGICPFCATIHWLLHEDNPVEEVESIRTLTEGK